MVPCWGYHPPHAFYEHADTFNVSRKRSHQELTRPLIKLYWVNRVAGMIFHAFRIIELEIYFRQKPGLLLGCGLSFRASISTHGAAYQ